MVPFLNNDCAKLYQQHMCTPYLIGITSHLKFRLARSILIFQVIPVSAFWTLIKLMGKMYILCYLRKSIFVNKNETIFLESPGDA